MYTLLVQPTDRADNKGDQLYTLACRVNPLSLVCCWGPAAFHLPGYMSCDFFFFLGGGGGGGGEGA